MAVPPPQSASDKKALRARLRAERAAFVERLTTAGGLPAALDAAAGRVLPHVPPGAGVALYHPFGDEIDPQPLAAALAARGHTLALPHVADDRTAMRFFAWAPGAALVPGVFGLHQPDPAGAEVMPAAIVTPLVGFDRRGGRIGQGAGYYDRAFAALPGARRIGYAWSVQEVAAMPRDPWDVPLHAIATEREWIVTEEEDA